MGYWRGLSFQVQDELIEQAPVGAMKLFFGCRRSGEDFLYREELLQFHEQGGCGLACLSCAPPPSCSCVYLTVLFGMGRVVYFLGL